MKVKLVVSAERYDEIKNYLEARGIEVDDGEDNSNECGGQFTLTETGQYVSILGVRNSLTNEKQHITVRDIIYLESFGHSVEVHTAEGTYQSPEPLYKLCCTLDPAKFLRVSNSVVISVNKVRKIRPALSKKFVLTMINDELVDVTRSYYDNFKNFFGI